MTLDVGRVAQRNFSTRFIAV